MQFHIPQYIDIEDKLFGPLTLKQAIYVAGGAGGAYVIYRLMPGYLFISAPIIAAIAVFTWALAFYPKEKLGKPFVEILEAAFNYMRKEKLYTWKKTARELELGTEETFVPSQPAATPAVPRGTLSSASFGLDIKGPEKSAEKELGKNRAM
jgi:hypothetical protein